MRKLLVFLCLLCFQLQADEGQGERVVQRAAQAASEALEHKTSLNAELKAELLQMEEEDQLRRKALLSGGSVEPIQEMDRKHNARLKEIIQIYGWPGIKLVGIKGSHAMWLLVQHQDEDLPFQKECLKLLKEAVDHQDAAFANYAYLLDRVRKNEGLAQVYGTQWIQRDGKWALYPVEEDQNLNQRRLEAGLPSIEEYRKLFKEMMHLNDSDFE